MTALAPLLLAGLLAMSAMDGGGHGYQHHDHAPDANGGNRR